jgi:hypothetical protein
MGPWAASDAVVRLSWPSASLVGVLKLLDEIRMGTRVEFDLSGRAAVGAGFLRLMGSEESLRKTVDRLRESAPLVGAVTVLRAAAALKQQIDPWGELGSSRPTLEAIKRAFDPNCTLNAERGPV